MNLLLRSGAIIFLGGGGACVVPFMRFPSLSKEVSSTTSVTHSSEEGDNSQQFNSVSSSSHLERSGAEVKLPLEEVRVEEKNCSLKTEKDEVTSKLTDSPRFVTFSCDNSGKDDSEINSFWTVWLPVSFLRDQGEGWLTEGQKIEIKTDTSHIQTDLEDSFDTEFYKTTFESDSFVHKTITGEWGKNYFEDSWEEVEDDAYIWKVKVTDPKIEPHFIYLRLKK